MRQDNYPRAGDGVASLSHADGVPHAQTGGSDIGAQNGTNRLQGDNDDDKNSGAVAFKRGGNGTFHRGIFRTSTRTGTSARSCNRIHIHTKR